MNDLTALGLFVACVLATFGLRRGCEWLQPREHPRSAASPRGVTKEARQ